MNSIFPDGISMTEIVAAVKRTKNIFENSEAARKIHQKGPSDFVTEVEFQVQEYLAGELARLRPEIQFMGEERDNSALNLDGSLWILDPVDGTTNLIHGYR